MKTEFYTFHFSESNGKNCITLVLKIVKKNANMFYENGT
jgi:hypothetical protein